MAVIQPRPIHTAVRPPPAGLHLCVSVAPAPPRRAGPLADRPSLLPLANAIAWFVGVEVRAVAETLQGGEPHLLAPNVIPISTGIPTWQLKIKLHGDHHDLAEVVAAGQLPYSSLRLTQGIHAIHYRP